MDHITAFNTAKSTPIGSPAYNAAYALCMARGMDPSATHRPGLPMVNWKYVVVEALLLKAIAS